MDRKMLVALLIVGIVGIVEANIPGNADMRNSKTYFDEKEVRDTDCELYLGMSSCIKCCKNLGPDWSMAMGLLIPVPDARKCECKIFHKTNSFMET